MGKLFVARAALICISICFTQLFTVQWVVAQTAADSTEKELTPRTPEMAEKALDESRRVTLDVVAIDSKGTPITGLERQNFTILDNDHPQEMLSFDAAQGVTAESPVEMILLIDMVNTDFHRVAFVRQQIARFLRQNNGQLAYPTALAVFTDTGTEILPSTRDGYRMADLLTSSDYSLRIIRRSAGVYGANERLQLSLTALDYLVSREGTKPGRKLLIWVSPGWPLLEGPDILPQEQNIFFRWIADYSNALRSSRITLYSIDPRGLGGDFSYESFLKGVRKQSDASSGKLALQVLAMHSGGKVLNSSNDLLGEINACVADASSYYVMSFEAPPSDQVDEYHALTVKVDKPKIKTRTTAAYYGMP